MLKNRLFIVPTSNYCLDSNKHVKPINCVILKTQAFFKTHFKGMQLHQPVIFTHHLLTCLYSC